MIRGGNPDKCQIALRVGRADSALLYPSRLLRGTAPRGSWMNWVTYWARVGMWRRKRGLGNEVDDRSTAYDQQMGLMTHLTTDSTAPGFTPVGIRCHRLGWTV